jgi:CRISPR-associated endonuclease Csn1
MRLMIDDFVRLHLDGKTKTLRVAKMSGNGQVFLAPVNEANVDARNRDPNESFGYVSKMAGSLKAAQARRVTISRIGELRDPGFKE